MTERRMPYGQITILFIVTALLLVLLIRHPGAPSPANPPRTQTLAFTLEGNPDLTDGLYAVDMNGDNLRLLADSALTYVSPAWSSDGKSIAYISGNKHSGDRDLWLMDADGKNRHPLTQTGEVTAYIGFSQEWSPDGRYVVFIYTSEVTIMNVATGTLRRLTDVGRHPNALPDNVYSSPSWSPDGRYLAFEAYNKTSLGDVYLLDAACGTSPNGCDTQWEIINTGEDHSYDWSPNGQYVVFGSNRAGKGNFDLFIMDAATRKARQLTDSPLADWNPAWAPDGKQIAFTSNSADGKQHSINIIQPDGSNLRQLSNLEAYRVVWSLDSQYIAFVANEELFVMKADGTSLRSLGVNHVNYASIVWRP